MPARLLQIQCDANTHSMATRSMSSDWRDHLPFANLKHALARHRHRQANAISKISAPAGATIHQNGMQRLVAAAKGAEDRMKYQEDQAQQLGEAPYKTTAGNGQMIPLRILRGAIFVLFF